MKSILKTLAVLITLISFPAWADHGGSHDHSGTPVEDTGSIQAGLDGAKCEDKIVVKVNGLVCDFCARATEKVFGQREEVAGVKVDLDSGEVTIAVKPGQKLDDETISKLILDAGYNVTGITRGC